MTHRRGNGLLADSYVPLASVSLMLADLLLEALREAGIAAYAVALDADETSGSAAPAPQEFPVQDSEATDRVYVDAEARQLAIQILRVELPGPVDSAGDAASAGPEVAGKAAAAESSAAVGANGVDAVWDDLVARFYEQRQPDVSWPDAENVSREPAPDPQVQVDDDDSTAADSDEPQRRAAPSGDDEDHYIPPPPPPIPSGDLVSRLAWAGVLGGPALALIMVLLGQSLPPWLGFCVVAGFIAGFVVLVVRMEDRPPRGSDPDDGAIT